MRVQVQVKVKMKVYFLVIYTLRYIDLSELSEFFKNYLEVADACLDFPETFQAVL